jgi:hypothetical protein
MMIPQGWAKDKGVARIVGAATACRLEEETVEVIEDDDQREHEDGTEFENVAEHGLILNLRVRRHGRTPDERLRAKGRAFG